MKTPEEIKCSLEAHGIGGPGSCEVCAYNGTTTKELCIDIMLSESLTYIIRLETERDALIAALKEIDVFGECRQCVHRKEDDSTDCIAADYDCLNCAGDCICKNCINGSNWQWSGLANGAVVLGGES